MRRCSRASMRCTGRATRSGWRPSRSGCSNAIICASCAPGRCSIRRRKRAWRRSPSGSRHLHTLFGQNVLHDEDEWRLVLDEADLAGLPEFARAAARRGGRRARPRRQVRHHPGARLGRAVSDIFGAPRSAPHGVRSLGGARRASGRARQPAADRRNHGIARRAGAAARLSDLCRLPARRCDGADAGGRARPAGAGLGAGPRARPPRSAPNWRRRRWRTGSTSRSRHGTGATTPRRCDSGSTRSTRPS